MINESSTTYKKLDTMNRRAFIISVAKLVVFTGIVSRLFSLQINDNKKSEIYMGWIEKRPVATEGKWTDLDYTKSNFYPIYANGCAGYILSRGILNFFIGKLKIGQLKFYPNRMKIMTVHKLLENLNLIKWTTLYLIWDL